VVSYVMLREIGYQLSAISCQLSGSSYQQINAG